MNGEVSNDDLDRSVAIGRTVFDEADFIGREPKLGKVRFAVPLGRRDAQPDQDTRHVFGHLDQEVRAAHGHIQDIDSRYRFDPGRIILRSVSLCFRRGVSHDYWRNAPSPG